MATIRITSPQAKGHAKITVKGRPKLVFVNGHWNRVMHFLGMGPGKNKVPYWEYFLGGTGGVEEFINAAKAYFNDKITKIIHFMPTVVLFVGEIWMDRNEKMQVTHSQMNTLRK